MKYLIIIILIAFMANGCLGQYPKSEINEKGKVYNSNAQTKDDSVLTIDVSDATYPLRIIQDTDSTKYYWKKEVYWENRMNDELERLNRTGHAKDISKSLLRYQDSAIKYKMLLDNLKSK